MSGCPGVHCPGCGKGGGALAILAAAAIAAIVAWREAVKAGHAVEHGTDVLRHVTFEVLEWTAIALVSALALAVVGVVALALVRVRQRAALRAAQRPAVTTATCRIVPGVPGRAAPAVQRYEVIPLAIGGRAVSDEITERR